MLGLLDDAILVPVGIWAAVKLIPPETLTEHRRTAEAASARPVSRAAAVVVVTIWLLAAWGIGWLAFAWWTAGR